MNTLRIATRPSSLARCQAAQAAGMLRAASPGLQVELVVITTKGDKVLDRPLPEIGGKGLFTQELEQALHAGRVDAAVHSLKDLPVEDAPGLTVGAVPRRASPADVLVSTDGRKLDDLPEGAVVGTSSLRRQAQLLARQPDLRVASIRGNIDTRIRKVLDGEYAAAILAAAGLERLGLTAHIAEYLSLDWMLPAPGQGALALQCRAGDERTLAVLSLIEDADTRRAVTAERAFLQALGGGCSLPVAAFAEAPGADISLQTAVLSEAGDRRIALSGSGADPHVLGNDLARQALARGAAEVLHV
ncbi:MAG: hydroxymethylbilane synthase [Chloroflexi bacterium]|nr:hydroxymethylbilane synthase [Chloroflexota bacterium]